MTPMDPKLLKFLETEKLAMQRRNKTSKKKKDRDLDVNNTELTPADKVRIELKSCGHNNCIINQFVVL